MTENPVRIASYNIRKARGIDQKRRPERTLQVINDIGADIIVLQEADRRLGSRHPALPRKMIEAETDYRLVEVCANGISIGWHGNAVLVRKETAVRGISRIDLPGLEPRGAVQVDFDYGNGLSVIAAHLGLRRRDRRAQLSVLRDVTRDNANTVIAGDFNEWSNIRGLEPLADHFETCAPGLSFHARRPMASLDRFALSSQVTMHDAGVVQTPLAQRASDHLPIWSDVFVPQSTC